MGQVLTGGSGQNPQDKRLLNLNVKKPAYVVNQVCGSGMRSIISGFQSIKSSVQKFLLLVDKKHVFGSSRDTLRDGKSLVTQINWYDD